VKPIVTQIVTLILVFAVTIAVVYFADEAITLVPVEGELPDVSVSEAATDLLLSAGITPVIATLIEIAKVLGWLPDGTAGKVQAVGQALAYLVVLFAHGFFGLDVMNPTTQSILGVVLVVLQAGLSILGAVGFFKLGRANGWYKPLPGRV
jgi:hypothetical protein